MKESRQFIGLSVIELSTGKKLGTVEAIAVNPDGGCIDFLLLDRDKWYGELRALPFDTVFGVGEYAVTVERSDSIHNVSENPELVAVLEKDVQIVKAVVLTKTGRHIGTVKEYIIDEDTGSIKDCLVSNEDGKRWTIPGDMILTYGSNSLIIEDQSCMPKNTDDELPENSSDCQRSFQNPQDLSDVFEKRQHQFLLGKRAAKRIVGDDLQVIIDEGDIITEDIIEKASLMDKYIELRMSIMLENDD